MDNFLNPKKVLDQLELDKEMTAVDLGCGSGSWVLPLAEKLEDGQVAAIDILEEPLSALEGKAKQENLSNIKTILADVEKDSKLDDESSDLVLIGNGTKIIPSCLNFERSSPPLEPICTLWPRFFMPLAKFKT